MVTGKSGVVDVSVVDDSKVVEAVVVTWSVVVDVVGGVVGLDDIVEGTTVTLVEGLLTVVVVVVTSSKQNRT